VVLIDQEFARDLEGYDDDLRDPLTTLTEWRRYVDEPEAEFELMEEPAWRALPDERREDEQESRLAYHSQLVQVRTPAVSQIAVQARTLILLNRRERAARRHLVVSGNWATGKTTALHLLGRTHELRVRRRYPGSGQRIPVVYVSTPPNGSPRKLAMEMAHFLGLPVPRRWENAMDVADSVCSILRRARCELVLVDEIQRLDLATRAGEDMSDHIKHIAEHTAATFVYAGIDVENSSVFTGVRGQQFAARAVMIHTAKFPTGAAWDDVVGVMDNAIRLYDHVPGRDSLSAHTRYLHKRTGGSISSLSHLVRAAAQRAIITGTEKITEDLMDQIELDTVAATGS
jgi:TniB protein